MWSTDVWSGIAKCQDHFCIKFLNELGVQKIVGISLNILFLGNI